MSNEGLSAEDMAAESATALPDKEVVSILDLNADLDLAIDAAAPIDLAVAANANVAAPIDAAVGANVLSEGSSAQALADQGALINQDVTGDATAESVQDSGIEQGDAAATPADAGDVRGTDGGLAPIVQTTGADGADRRRLRRRRRRGGWRSRRDRRRDGHRGRRGRWRSGRDRRRGGHGGRRDGGAGGVTDGVADGVGGVTDGVGSIADGNLLNVNVDLAADADIAAPINGAVAANANVAAPIDAAVAANIGSIDSDAVAVAQQDAIINQGITGDASASADQASEISQPDQPQP